MNIRSAPVKANPGAVPKAAETSAVKYTDEAAIRDAIKEVRKDNIDPRTVNKHNSKKEKQKSKFFSFFERTGYWSVSREERETH